jgi:ComF family protein
MPTFASFTLPFRIGAAAVTHALRRLPGECPLCSTRATGGDLCAPCQEDVLWSTHKATLPRCDRCALRLPRLGMACPDCASIPPVFARSVIAFDYAAPADLLVLQLKQRGQYARAGLLARLLAEAVRRAAPLDAAMRLVPVPASRASLRRRGFNPSNEIARRLGKELGLPVRRDLLERVREASVQHTLGREARARNSIGLFQATRPIPGWPVAVVDDVMTTGATMDAVSRALLDAGASSVVALAVARTPFPVWHANEG